MVTLCTILGLGCIAFGFYRVSNGHKESSPFSSSYSTSKDHNLNKAFNSVDPVPQQAPQSTASSKTVALPGGSIWQTHKRPIIIVSTVSLLVLVLVGTGLGVYFGYFRDSVGLKQLAPSSSVDGKTVDSEAGAMAVDPPKFNFVGLGVGLGVWFLFFILNAVISGVLYKSLFNPEWHPLLRAFAVFVSLIFLQPLFGILASFILDAKRHLRESSLGRVPRFVLSLLLRLIALPFFCLSFLIEVFLQRQSLPFNIREQFGIAEFSILKEPSKPRIE
jgi:hypothetical protein